ncbi:hypothetical protein QBC40DRAFT_344103 [Triangularia verruculosa]|uniref:FAD-binding PCMH-type domain-containing protein n=1 Tax=Triangularia verruculosa TaxID=2587418 RepID=A0AAN6X7M3_9PEZI|nr:hypothetical protein QBC40DRAFT_344103 [Triangularia verruculosa]
MATLDTLKRTLLQKASETEVPSNQPLSDEQYSHAFDIFLKGAGWKTYQEFIIPQLSQLLDPLFHSRLRISILEVGPGPKSVLEHLPDSQKRKITKYAAFEPNKLFASRLEEWFRCTPFPSLEHTPEISRSRFSSGDFYHRTKSSLYDEKFDVIIFCHSMYGMKDKQATIQRAVNMLVQQPGGGLVVVFHRDSLRIQGMASYRTGFFPTGLVSVADSEDTLDCFAQFITGKKTQDGTLRALWRNKCRELGACDTANPGSLLFSAPDVMVAFTRHAPTGSEYSAPAMREQKMVKNRQACVRFPAITLQPTGIAGVQHCVTSALKGGTGLTVVGGGHSGHCLWFNIRSVDMGLFNKVHVVASEDIKVGSFIVAEAGCKTVDIIRKASEAGLTVPLGARPSVGAGLWLQGGIGHLSRLHGLACDSIVGAVVVSADAGKLFSVGYVPEQYRCPEAVQLDDSDLLWAIQGAGTNFGIVTSVTFKAYPAPAYTVRSWRLPFDDLFKARAKLREFDHLIARDLPRTCSADAYLFWDEDRLHIAVTMFETSTATSCVTLIALTRAYKILGPEKSIKTTDSIGVFDAEMYMSEMHGGHGGGKTSSFKRCLFLKDIGQDETANVLIKAIETRPTPLCYLHLLQGGGAIRDVPADATAFGCRDWDFACVITGVWPRDQDGTKEAVAAVRWVYDIAEILLPLSTGAYGADLGPDPRDAALAAKAFGPNLPRLARLKQRWDPRDILAYACPLPTPPKDPRLIILVTGESGAGKDFCADVWRSLFMKDDVAACVSSISEATKRQYATETGADLSRLLEDRAYKEQHREALTAFFQTQVKKRPRLPEEHFLRLVHSAKDAEVLLITGMRDKAPVAAFSHLVPDSRLVEVRVEASEEVRSARRGADKADIKPEDKNGTLDYAPSFNLRNDGEGELLARAFFSTHLQHLVDPDLQSLTEIIRQIPDFPNTDINFRHILGVAQSRGGLKLCTALLQSHYSGDWSQILSIVCVETGGFIFASALAVNVDVPLALIREKGKLPPPVVSVAKEVSHISGASSGKKAGVIRKGGKVVVVDDVLATGNTLCAVLRLLVKVGVEMTDISVIVVAEFPLHKGRELLCREGFGKVNVQSLLAFGGF